MNTSLTRRLLVGAAGLAIGAAGAIAVASPASAHHPIVSAVCETADSGDWVVTWTVSNSEWDLTGTIDSVKPTPAADLSPIAEGATLPVSGDDPLTADQVVPGDITTASLEVGAKWDRSGDGVPDKSASASADISVDDCKTPEPTPTPPPEPTPTPEPKSPVTLEFDCETATVTLTNETEEDATVEVVPSEGDPVEVTVPAGGEESTSFPSSEGLTIDIQVDGESVLEGEPLEITSEDWADLECEDEGEGGELPVTGSSTTLIAGGAIALLAAGGGLFWFARRRRVTFTA